MGKAHYMAKGLTEVRSPQRKLIPDMAGSEHDKQTSLRGIANTAHRDPEHRFRNLYGLLDVGMLRLAWQQLDKQSAIADDSLTVTAYAANLEDNLSELAGCLKAKRYRAKLVKRRYIPKENGKPRPLGIPALEDKIVQKAVAMLLDAIYEQEFLDCSYGYRRGRSPKQAVQDLKRQLQFGCYGYVVEADIKGFFDHLNHDQLLDMLGLRIDDRAFLRLIRKWLKAGILEPDGAVIHPETGVPQGGLVSAILANLYLHQVLDQWFEGTVKPCLEGKALICRYADDWVCAFQYKEDAERFYRTLPKRLANYGLQTEPSKTRLLRFSRFAPLRSNRFTFLGFEWYWAPDRQGVARVHIRTAPKRLRGKLKQIGEWIKTHRHLPGRLFFKQLRVKLTGHYRYYYLRGNAQAVWRFYQETTRRLFKWYNRRSQRKSWNWRGFGQLLRDIGLPSPKGYGNATC